MGWQLMKLNKSKCSVLHLGKEQPHATVPAGDDPNVVFLLEKKKIQLFKLCEHKGLLCYLFCETVPIPAIL